MKKKDLIKAIYKGLPKEQKDNPELETYESLTEEQKKEVDELSKDVIDWLENEDNDGE